MDIDPLMTSILSAVASAFEEDETPPGRVELTPGLLPAWDDCCAGQLYLRVREIFPTAGSGSPFPQFDAQQKGVNAACAIHMVSVSFAVGMMRCAAVLDDNGNAPTPEAVSADAREMYHDMNIILQTLVCGLKEIKAIQGLKMDRWIPQGVNGGCHGGEWGAMIAVDPCLCKP